MSDTPTAGDGRMLNDAAVADLLSISKPHLWRLRTLVKDPALRFPEPSRLGRSTRWLRSEVLAWQERTKGKVIEIEY